MSLARQLLGIAVAIGLGIATRPARAEIAVPAYTAYVHPEPRGAEVADAGISGGSDPATTIHWYGLVRRAGDLAARLVVDGPAAAAAHFNLEPRRNAASVHLVYPVDRDADVRAFAAEVTAVEAPIHSFFMACGWHRGYLGMQVNSATERRIICSVWDSGAEAVDRTRVRDEDRVRLVAKGEGVVASDFGHEGTGGHSHLTVAWRTGVPQRFLVTAAPRGAARAGSTGSARTSWETPAIGCGLRCTATSGCAWPTARGTS